MSRKMLITLLFNVNNSSKTRTSPQCDKKSVHIKKRTHYEKKCPISRKIGAF